MSDQGKTCSKCRDCVNEVFTGVDEARLGRAGRGAVRLGRAKQGKVFF